MIVNFRARGINRNTRKLAQTPTLKKIYIVIQYKNTHHLEKKNSQLVVFQLSLFFLF